MAHRFNRVTFFLFISFIFPPELLKRIYIFFKETLQIRLKLKEKNGEGYLGHDDKVLFS